MDSYNPSGLSEEELKRLYDTEVQEYTGEPNDSSTPDTTPTQKRLKKREAERLEQERVEAEQTEQAKYNYSTQSGRFSAGTEADYKAMEVLAPVVTAAAGLPFIDLGMDVVGYDPAISVEAAWQLSSQVERMDSLEALLAKSDFVTLHVPAIPATKHLINSET